MPLSLVTAPAAEPLTIAEIKQQLELGTTAGEPAPTAPTVALLSPAAPGNCDNGAHRLGFTFVTLAGESEIGPLSDVVTIIDKTVNGKIAASNIAIGGSAVTARKAYLVPVAGGAAKYAATLSNNTDSTMTINIADAALGVDAPTVNTTADPILLQKLTAVRERGELATLRAFMPQTWDLLLDGPPACGYIEVPKPPLQTVSYIHYLDAAGVSQTWAASNYVVQAPAGPRARRGRIALSPTGSWPTTNGQMGAITVRFVCGYASAAAVPALLKSAMLLDLATLYAQRENVITGTIVAELPGGVHDMYWSYRSHPTQRVAA